MSIADVLDWIDRRFLCASLVAERGSVERVFHVSKGCITHVSSNVPGERLGQLLLQRGLLEETTLRQAFSTQRQTGVALGKVLLMVNAISEDTLSHTLEQKVIAALNDTVSWAEGTFRVELEPESREMSAFAISVKLRGLLDSANSEIDRRREIRALIPSLDTRFYGTTSDQDEDTDDEEFLERVAQAARRGMTAAQIVLKEHGDTFQVLSALAELVEAGDLRIDRRSALRSVDTPTATDLETAARGRSQGGDKAGALELVRLALELAPENEAIQQLQREVEQTLLSQLTRDLLSGYSVPKLLKSQEELAEIELNDKEQYLVGRIDGHWDLLSILRVAPLREVEVLLTFKRLAARGIISLS